MGLCPMFRNQPLVVVGGGDSACEEAMYLTRFASIVYLVHRRDSLRASKVMAARTLTHKKIQPIWDTVVTDILDVKQDKVTGIRLKNVKQAQKTSSTVPECSWPLATCQTPRCSKASSTWMRMAILFQPKVLPPMCRESLWQAIAPTGFIGRPSRLPAWVAQRQLTPNATWLR